MKSHDKKNPIPQLITGKPNTNHTVLRVTFNINVYIIYIYIYQSINTCYKFYKSYIRQYKIKPYEKNTMACLSERGGGVQPDVATRKKGLISAVVVTSELKPCGNVSTLLSRR